MSSTTAPSSPSSGPPPPPKYIKIISSEGHSFFLPRAVACAGSTTLAAMLRGGEDEDDTYSFMEGREGVVRLPDIRSRIVEKVCQYLLYKEQYAAFDRDDSDLRDRAGGLAGAARGVQLSGLLRRRIDTGEVAKR
eukprot:CAMPEP_0113307770 /NCGR_PEP_ID=MMETSP0010_2-20120614/6484_1 /TAXON_ID=216773 ORGANISM="Corethron hystrix, Strain 308" /NCGR_SAMPLE_ID=MMETSP0010_2 /ASSEMBLY_ACC=CAM_ASM_000155 /LENGTH=134 /DNA_ID=CAMNT_0000162695 /DNA_START=89 /DNA_END=495 /DNA_ORIENTATION=+ /assembly_acc=CAM_ASM_000155